MSKTHDGGSTSSQLPSGYGQPRFPSLSSVTSFAKHRQPMAPRPMETWFSSLFRPSDSNRLLGFFQSEPSSRMSEVIGGDDRSPPNQPNDDALLVLLPLLIILSTLLFLLLVFLICVLFLRKRRGIALRENDGPIDMSREELIDGEGGFEGVESRWLENSPEEVRRAYRRAKEWQLQYPPNSLPTDITLSQFLSIQEKGVSAWCFEPDYEAMPNVLVHFRTELTFLPDPSSYSCVQSNLPLPKLNEVYYWEVKMFDMPPTTMVSIGLATKPYPLFRMPGWSRYSVAYHSNGEKSYNYPFTSTSFGHVLKEGDVLGVGYRPRTGTVFFTRNGRKFEDAFVGLNRWNLFPTIGADGPCTLHVNLGQAGFVYIEANVKKWGLAPSVGTLAPPPAYGSERGSILLEAGGGVRNRDTSDELATTSSSPPRRTYRLRRPKPRSRVDIPQSSSQGGLLSPPPPITPQTPPPPLTPLLEEGPSTSRYISPTDSPFHAPVRRAPSPTTALASTPGNESGGDVEASSGTPTPTSRSPRARPPPDMQISIQIEPPESPLTSQNPPTPNILDIHLQPLPGGSAQSTPPHNASLPVGHSAPPAYSPIDAFTYADGVHMDLPAEVIAAALENSSAAQAQGSREGRRSGRR